MYMPDDIALIKPKMMLEQTMEQAAVKIVNAHKAFSNTQVLKALNMTVPTGSIYALLGNNGAGKSTLLSMLLGALKPEQGDIRILGEPVSMRLKSHLGCLIDAPAFYQNLTIKEFLSYCAKMKGLPKQCIDEALTIVNLQAKQHTRLKRCSLGMKQRAAIANAILGQPELLILDEPTNGLDPSGIEEIRTLIRTLPERFNTTVLFSSHVLEEVEKVATHVGILAQGNLVIEGSLPDLLDDPLGTLEVSISAEHTDKAQTLLSRVFKVSTPEAGKITIHQIDKSLCPQVYKSLLAQNIDFYQFHYHKQSLSKLFNNIHLSINKEAEYA